MPELEGAAVLPPFPVPDGQTEEAHLRTLVEDGLAARFDVLEAAGCSFAPEIYRARAHEELDAISKLGHARYFLIVGDLSRWANSRGIPVGPGRGSSAGCLVSWTLGVTDIDPIVYKLPFERFLNPERSSFPEIGVDVCIRRREEFLPYLADRYGNDNVARLADDPRLNDCYSSLRRITVVITKRPVREYMPCDVGRDGIQTTPLDKAAVEKTGLVTFDFHSLETLTRIHDVVARVNAPRSTPHPRLNIAAIPANDPAVFRLLADGDTTDVFQFESEGMRAMLRRLRPDCMEDVAATTALYRPGPLESGMVEAFIARKHGREPIEYLHPLIEPILADTYGVLVYQEQAMQIAQAIAGISLGRADLLRRALGKKRPVEINDAGHRFAAGAMANGIDVEDAHAIFDYLEEMSGFGFNRAHAAAYGWITYQTAYLKRHFPTEFTAAVEGLRDDHVETHL